MYQYRFHKLPIFLMFLLSAYPTLAHDGSDHGGTLEMWISGVGIIAIISVTIYRLWWQQRGLDYSLDDDRDLLKDDA